jgi:hypothetical protein
MEFDQYVKIKQRFGRYANWAIWNDQDIKNTEIIEESISELNAKFVTLGLNISKPFDSDWVNFRIGKHDRKLKALFNKSPARGSYMTDLIKGFPEPDSKKVLDAIKKDQSILNRHIEEFNEETNLIGADTETVFILLGGDVNKLITPFLGTSKYKSNKVIQITHHSYYGFTDSDWIERASVKLFG